MPLHRERWLIITSVGAPLEGKVGALPERGERGARGGGLGDAVAAQVEAQARQMRGRCCEMRGRCAQQRARADGGGDVG